MNPRILEYRLGLQQALNRLQVPAIQKARVGPDLPAEPPVEPPAPPSAPETSPDWMDF